MHFFRKYLLVLLLSPDVIFSQGKVIKDFKTTPYEGDFGFGIGYARSVLYLPINVATNNDARGFHTIFTYDKGNYIRGSFEYAYFNRINIRPTWEDVRAQTFELNMQFISRTKNNVYYFYPLTGISFNVFKGYFTGINDYLNLTSVYKQNKTVTLGWLGVNAGLGMDYNLEDLSIYANFKMRVGKTAGYNQLNIMDVFTVAGLKLHVQGATLKKIFKGTRSRYVLKSKKPTK